MRIRMHVLWVFGVIALIVLGVQACALISGKSSTFQPANFVFDTFSHQNIERVYGLYEPEALVANAPLVFLLHGGGGAAQQIFDTEYGQSWRQLADQNGFLLVVPEGREDGNSPEDHHWNDCRTGILNPEVNTQLDDVGFITALIDLLSARFSIDSTKVFATGASNGGMMSFRLAFEASERFAAIGAVIANIPDPSECSTPTAPISVLIMNGTQDPLMPYEGGCVANTNCLRGSVLSTDVSVEFWIDFNATSSTPIVENLPNIAPGDDSTVTTSLYENGMNNTEVLLYRIDGGGHTVPGEEQLGLAARLVVGSKNQDINGAFETWEFFNRQTR